MFAGKLFLRRSGKDNFATPLIFAALLGLAAVVAFAPQIPNPTLSAGLLSPAFAAIVYGAAMQPKWLSFFTGPWLVLPGDASYSLYLLHSLVITRAFDSFPHLAWSIRVALSLAAAIVASIAAYKLVEEPARRFLRPKNQNQSSRPE
jgi:peptidoglycan/LPS O-acetylase OafA/YrhL